LAYVIQKDVSATRKEMKCHLHEVFPHAHDGVSVHLDADAERGQGRVVGLDQGGAIVLGVCEGGDVLTEPELAELLTDLRGEPAAQGSVE
jgi:hypothetical protein